MQKKRTTAIIAGIFSLVFLVLVKTIRLACKTSGRLMRGDQK